NVESDLLRQEMKAGKGLSRLMDGTRYWDLRRLEKLGARWADIITAITNVDLEYYMKLKDPERVFLLPFGYPTTKEPGNPVQNTEDPNTVYFFGSMDWPPNAVAARNLVEKIMPEVWKAIPEAKCFLVGKNPGEQIIALGSRKVTVTGKVPSVREYYRRAAVVAVPIGGVGGVKIKLMEAMAAGKAIVSTPAGAAGVMVEHGKHLLIADRPADFARALTELLGNESARRKLGSR
ncbi:MAG: glycosyltransferase family 4 protein, partial [Actinomycetota bacterium]